MTAALVVAAALLIAVALYLRFGRPRFLADIGNMTPLERADVLLQATIWRLRWEADNPHLRQIFIDPQDFPPEVCKKMASELFEVWFPLWQNQKALNGRLRALGSTEKLPDADI